MRSIRQTINADHLDVRLSVPNRCHHFDSILCHGRIKPGFPKHVLRRLIRCPAKFHFEIFACSVPSKTMDGLTVVVRILY